MDRTKFIKVTHNVLLSTLLRFFDVITLLSPWTSACSPPSHSSGSTFFIVVKGTNKNVRYQIHRIAIHHGSVDEWILRFESLGKTTRPSLSVVIWRVSNSVNKVKIVKNISQPWLQRYSQSCRSFAGSLMAHAQLSFFSLLLHGGFHFIAGKCFRYALFLGIHIPFCLVSLPLPSSSNHFIIRQAEQRGKLGKIKPFKWDERSWKIFYRVLSSGLRLADNGDIFHWSFFYFSL